VLNFESNGTGTRETTVVARVQSPAGVKDLAILTFAYTSYNQVVDIVYVRVRKPDGTVVETPPANVQDMPSAITRGAPMYSDLQEKHVTLKALGVGDVVEYQVRYRTVRPQVEGEFWFQQNFTKLFVVKEEVLEISVPRDKYVKVTSPGYPPAVTEDKTKRTYTWKTANPTVKEGSLLTLLSEEATPSVDLTTFKDWAQVGSWYQSLAQPQMTVTPQIRAKAAELTRGLTSDDDKIRAIYSFVSTNFHYVSLSFGVGRYQPHAAQEVLENEYGDCKDKHTLLAALLKAAGFEAWPALMNSAAKIDPSMPSPGRFNHVVTVVTRGDRMIWLDTTPEVAPFGLLLSSLRDKLALVMPNNGPASLMKTPAQPPVPLSQTLTANGKLADDGTYTAHVQQTANGDGEFLNRLAFHRASMAKQDAVAKRFSLVADFGGELSNLNVTAPEDLAKPFRMSYDYTKPSYSEWSSQRIVAPLPWFGIESVGAEEEKPKDPAPLGAVGEVIRIAHRTATRSRSFVFGQIRCDGGLRRISRSVFHPGW
jgi:hypothetical protein